MDSRRMKSRRRCRNKRSSLACIAARPLLTLDEDSFTGVAPAGEGGGGEETGMLGGGSMDVSRPSDEDRVRQTARDYYPMRTKRGGKTHRRG